MISAKAILYTFTFGALVLTAGSVAFGHGSGLPHRTAPVAARGHAGRAARLANLGPERAPRGRTDNFHGAPDARRHAPRHPLAPLGGSTPATSPA